MVEKERLYVPLPLPPVYASRGPPQPGVWVYIFILLPLPSL